MYEKSYLVVHILFENNTNPLIPPIPHSNQACLIFSTQRDSLMIFSLREGTIIVPKYTQFLYQEYSKKQISKYRRPQSAIKIPRAATEYALRFMGYVRGRSSKGCADTEQRIFEKV